MKQTPKQMVAAAIMAALERGVAPWQRPWNAAAGRPRNAKSRQPYHGINSVLTGMQGYESPWWMTYRQAAEMGGHVRKGEKGTPVIKVGKWAPKKPREGEDGRERMYLRSYCVFHASQIEGVEFPDYPRAKERSAVERVECLEAIVDAYRPRGPAIDVNGYARAYYAPAEDKVCVPDQSKFCSDRGFYGVLFHELAHSTGHRSRLDRKTLYSERFGDQLYSQEELVAEMSAGMVLAEAGVEPDVENSAAYCQSWLRALKCAGNAEKWIVPAASAADKAAAFILGEGRTA